MVAYGDLSIRFGVLFRRLVAVSYVGAGDSAILPYFSVINLARLDKWKNRQNPVWLMGKFRIGEGVELLFFLNTITKKGRRGKENRQKFRRDSQRKLGIRREKQ